MAAADIILDKIGCDAKKPRLMIGIGWQADVGVMRAQKGILEQFLGVVDITGTPHEIAIDCSLVAIHDFMEIILLSCGSSVRKRHTLYKTLHGRMCEKYCMKKTWWV